MLDALVDETSLVVLTYRLWGQIYTPQFFFVFEDNHFADTALGFAFVAFEFAPEHIELALIGLDKLIITELPQFDRVGIIHIGLNACDLVPFSGPVTFIVVSHDGCAGLITRKVG